MLLWILLFVILFALILVFFASLICFFKIFYYEKKASLDTDEYPTPQGSIYDPYREQMIQWIKDIRAIKHTEVSITSYDGLKLYGKYYEHKKGAPIEIMFHGYKGTAERDLCGGVYRCFELGRNALIVDQRAAGKSEGKVITFGAKERHDCISWVDYTVKNIDTNAKIILTGISMGAATVMMASSMPLPSNVIGILADCGYTSTQDIIKKVMVDQKLPPNLLYPFARLGAILFGGFDPDASSPIESMKKCSLPIIFFHGDTDDYVPCYMSQKNYDVCSSKDKQLVIIPGAGHGLCFPVDMNGYFNELKCFFKPYIQ